MRFVPDASSEDAIIVEAQNDSRYPFLDQRLVEDLSKLPLSKWKEDDVFSALAECKTASQGWWNAAAKVRSEITIERLRAEQGVERNTTSGN